MKTDLFQSCGHCWVSRICWHTECSTLTTSSFRIWSISAGIPSPPLSLFVVMLSKAHLTLHSRMSGWHYGWVTIVLWLSRSLRPFLCSFSIYSCHVFLISSASVRSLLLLSFTVPIFAWNVPLICNFLEEISSLSHSIVFLYFLHCSFKKTFLSLLCILWNSAFNWVYLSLSPLPFTSLLFSAICKASSDNHFAFLQFIVLGSGFGHCLLYNVMNLHP